MLLYLKKIFLKTSFINDIIDIWGLMDRDSAIRNFKNKEKMKQYCLSEKQEDSNYGSK